MWNGNLLEGSNKYSSPYASPPPPPPLSNSNSSSPSLSTSAKAAADAVIGFISRAENFIVSSTGVSPASGTGFCSSPRYSLPTTPAIEGIIPEGDDEHTDSKTVGNKSTNEFCISDHNCFEFVDFGFNAFQDNDANDNDKEQQQQQSCHPQPCNPVQPDWTSNQSEQQQKGCEIRLKSTFSQIKAREEAQREQKKATTPSAVFGRTHPNMKYKRSISQPNNNATSSNINNDQNGFSVHFLMDYHSPTYPSHRILNTPYPN